MATVGASRRKIVFLWTGKALEMSKRSVDDCCDISKDIRNKLRIVISKQREKVLSYHCLIIIFINIFFR